MQENILSIDELIADESKGGSDFIKNKELRLYMARKVCIDLNNYRRAAHKPLIEAEEFIKLATDESRVKLHLRARSLLDRESRKRQLLILFKNQLKLGESPKPIAKTMYSNIDIPKSKNDVETIQKDQEFAKFCCEPDNCRIICTNAMRKVFTLDFKNFYPLTDEEALNTFDEYSNEINIMSTFGDILQPYNGYELKADLEEFIAKNMQFIQDFVEIKNTVKFVASNMYLLLPDNLDYDDYTSIATSKTTLEFAKKGIPGFKIAEKAELDPSNNEKIKQYELSVQEYCNRCIRFMTNSLIDYNRAAKIFFARNDGNRNKPFIAYKLINDGMKINDAIMKLSEKPDTKFEITDNPDAEIIMDQLNDAFDVVATPLTPKEEAEAAILAVAKKSQNDIIDLRNQINELKNLENRGKINFIFECNTLLAKDFKKSDTESIAHLKRLYLYGVQKQQFRDIGDKLIHMKKNKTEDELIKKLKIRLISFEVTEDKIQALEQVTDVNFEVEYVKEFNLYNKDEYLKLWTRDEVKLIRQADFMRDELFKVMSNFGMTRKMFDKAYVQRFAPEYSKEIEQLIREVYAEAIIILNDEANQYRMDPIVLEKGLLVHDLRNYDREGCHKIYLEYKTKFDSIKNSQMNLNLKFR